MRRGRRKGGWMMQKTVRKYMPYSPLEFDKIESWFEEMAVEGLELTDMTGRFVKFKRGEPRRVRYRIGRSDCGRRTKSEEEYIDGCKELGWDFVTILGSEYYVFRTEDEEAVEFYTDVYAFMQDLERRIRSEILGAVALIAMGVFNSRGLFHYFGNGEIFISMVEDGFALFPYGIGMLLLVIALWVWRIVSMTKLRRRLSSGETTEHSGSLCRDRPIRAAAFALTLILIVAWLGYAWTTVHRLNHYDTQLIYTYQYSYNFPLLDEISAGEWSDIKTGIETNPYSYIANNVSFKHTELAPVIVMTHQRGYDQHAYTVNCYELRSEWLAEKYFEKKAAVFGDGGAEEIAFSGLDAVRYDLSDDGYEQNLLILKDSIVITVWYVGDSNLPEYLDLYAAYLD
ncbi:MAG: DUF2812 domain-containing protein [Erysipelotrichia bacterium]|nr:DUF2812 domain-containing protein [Clostridia bacterium]NCC54128.1 DUF2812 domain-containing protein [Erysipelotrichia bacterium]